MSEKIAVTAHVNPLRDQRLELVLYTGDGALGWTKAYDGSLFLSMDAQALDLLEEVLDQPKTGGPQYRLRQAGLVSIEQFERMRFGKLGE